MKKKKFILFLIILFLGIWFFQYFLGYIPTAVTFAMLIGLILWIVLLCIALYQIYKLLVEKTKDYSRLIFIGIILILNLLSLAKPTGIIDWEKLEGENILVAQMEGTANCQTVLKFKNDNIFKYTSYCFGMEFHFGTYIFKNDTLYLELDKNMGYMNKSSYAVLLRSKKDTTKFRQLNLFYDYNDRLNYGFSIIEDKMNKITER